MRIGYITLSAMLIGLSTPVHADDVDDAFRLCSAMEQSGATECKVGARKVDVTIDTNGSEARTICGGVVAQLAQTTRSFAGKWKLRIFSPYSGNRPIAVCTLL